MNYREFAKSLIDQIPENKLYYVILFLQGAAIPDKIPNTEITETIKSSADGNKTSSV